MGMKRLLSKSSICIFLVALFLFEAFCFETPVQAKKKSIKTPTISLSKCNDDAGIKIKIKKTKKAQAYEVYVCPVNTISLYEGCAADAFYVEGIPENSLDDNWHEKGVYYKQAEVKSTGEKYQYYNIDHMQSGTYKIKVRAYYTTILGRRVYSNYSKQKKITIGPDKGGNGLKTEYDFSELNVGDEFEFGSYEQDGNLKNGYEPIKWIVFSKNDDNIFVVSKYILDILPYNREYVSITWENCTLRKWLNEKFYRAAFNDFERELIKEVSITNEDNPVYGTDAGNTTTDKLIILSYNDATNPGYTFANNANEYDVNRRCASTEYAKNAGLGQYYIYTTSEGLGSSYWWLRTPGYKPDYGTYVHDFGYIGCDNSIYDSGFVYYSFGIRPAMFISVSNGIYEPDKALEYAKKHWSDGKGLCAEFVSDCINAGGVDVWANGCTTLRKLLLESGTGTEYMLTLNGNMSITATDYEGKLCPGDVVFYHCSKCMDIDGWPYVHAVICNGYDSDGYMKAYSHNNPNNGERKYFYNSHCVDCGGKIDYASVYHFNTKK